MKTVATIWAIQQPLVAVTSSLATAAENGVLVSDLTSPEIMSVIPYALRLPLDPLTQVRR